MFDELDKAVVLAAMHNKCPSVWSRKGFEILSLCCNPESKQAFKASVRWFTCNACNGAIASYCTCVYTIHYSYMCLIKVQKYTVLTARIKGLAGII